MKPTMIILALGLLLSAVTAHADTTPVCKNYTGSSSTAELGPITQASSVAVVSVLRMKGTGAIGEYQLETASDVDGPYTPVSNPASIDALGTIAIFAEGTFARVAVVDPPA